MGSPIDWQAGVLGFLEEEMWGSAGEWWRKE
jgi:hypothetical protein